MTKALAAAAAAALVGALVWGARTAPSSEPVRLGGYATRLTGRTASQRHNARLAARALDGARIGPGQILSFNDRVHAWSREPGYVRAPVSVDGTMVSALGGGVCQTATTLYNACLLSGLTLLERHPHTVAPGYVPPGRDAAVAYPGVDLRFRNPYPWAIHLRARADGDRLEVDVWGAKPTDARFAVTSRVLSASTPGSRSLDASPGRLRTTGVTGFRAVSERLVWKPGQPARRERLGDNTYATVDALIPTSLSNN